MLLYPHLVPVNLTQGNSTAQFDDSHTVSWQSAFWPVVACIVTVMLQNAGRVCGAPYRTSYALRASPVLCALDTLLMIIKFVWMLLLGCSPGTAAGHVWYDRFVMEHSSDWIHELFDRSHENAVVAPHFQRPESASRIVSTLSGDHVLDSGEEAKEQLHLETCVMSGALATPVSERTPTGYPIQELDNTGIRYGNEETGDIALGNLVTASEMANSGDGATYDSLDLSGSTRLPATCDLEAGIVMSATEHNPSIGAVQYIILRPGSGIDRAWRLTMAGFFVGALPQAIKVFGMRGIIATQIIVGVLISSFVVSEAFRLTAGTVGAPELIPMPSVVFAKERLLLWEDLTLIFALSCSLFIVWFCVISWTWINMSHNAVLISTNLVFVAPIVAFALNGIRGHLLELSTTKSLLKAITVPHSVKVIRKKSIAKLLSLFAIRTPHEDNVCMLGFFYLLAALTSLWPLTVVLSPRSDDIWKTLLPFFSFLGVWPAMLVPSYILFRLTFMGSLSKYPRKLCGLEGTGAEYMNFVFIGLHTLALLSCYLIWYEPEGTFKPRWADILG